MGIEAGHKEEFVHRLFDAIADRYDLMNRVLTAGVWGRWLGAFRRAAVPPAGGTALDVGCGTADLTLIMAEAVGPGGRVVGLDLSEAMLAVARRKVRRRGLEGRVALVRGNALDLPFPADSFDLVASGFVLRNVAHLPRALEEMARVTRPGGRVVVLELSHPPLALVRVPFELYFRRVVPLLGRWAARRLPGPVAPYDWLPLSWESFPDAPSLAALFRESGLADVEYRFLTGGIACLHWGRKPL